MCKLTHVRNKTPQEMINDRMAIIPKLSIFQFNNFYLKKKKKSYILWLQLMLWKIFVPVITSRCNSYKQMFPD